jgi:hypothetical protein
VRLFDGFYLVTAVELRMEDLSGVGARSRMGSFVRNRMELVVAVRTCYWEMPVLQMYLPLFVYMVARGLKCFLLDAFWSTESERGKGQISLENPDRGGQLLAPLIKVPADISRITPHFEI